MYKIFSVLTVLLSGFTIINFVGAPFEATAQQKTSPWRKIGTPPGPIQKIIFSADDELFALQFTGLLRSPDKGRTWTKIKIDVPQNYKIPTCVAFTGGVIFVGAKDITEGKSIIASSSDKGKTWTHAEFSPETSPYEIETLAAGKNGELWAGTNMGRIFYSTDQGKTWSASGKLPTFETVTSFAFGAEKRIYVAVARTGIFRSDDGGRTWAETGYGENAVDSVVVDSEGQLFAGTMKRGVLRSTDNGQTWVGINDSLPVLTVPALALDKNGVLYAATVTNGLFRSAESKSLR